MIFPDGYKHSDRRIVSVGILSMVALVIIIVFQQMHPAEKSSTERLAESYMSEMIENVSQYCKDSAIAIDTISDPQRTGLIGPEWTDITTTIGHLDAKRTTIQPEFAGLISKLFSEVGLKKNDTIAIGCSGSFPGIMLACISAAKASGVECKTILSIGASSYGANRINMNILDIYNIQYNKGLVDSPPLAVSLGGGNDTGEGWDEYVLSEIKRDIINTGCHFIYDRSLQKSVLERDSLYGFDKDHNIKAFLNAGGAMANIGTSSLILGLKPGIVISKKIPVTEKQGVIHKAFQRNIPVIHLLNIKGLAMEYGLKWDPVIR